MLYVNLCWGGNCQVDVCTSGSVSNEQETQLMVLFFPTPRTVLDLTLTANIFNKDRFLISTSELVSYVNLRPKFTANSTENTFTAHSLSFEHEGGGRGVFLR